MFTTLSAFFIVGTEHGGCTDCDLCRLPRRCQAKEHSESYCQQSYLSAAIRHRPALCQASLNRPRFSSSARRIQPFRIDTEFGDGCLGTPGIVTAPTGEAGKSSGGDRGRVDFEVPP